MVIIVIAAVVVIVILIVEVKMVVFVVAVEVAVKYRHVSGSTYFLVHFTWWLSKLCSVETSTCTVTPVCCARVSAQRSADEGKGAPTIIIARA